jgi:hypothetical protein
VLRSAEHGVAAAGYAGGEVSMRDTSTLRGRWGWGGAGPGVSQSLHASATNVHAFGVKKDCGGSGGSSDPSGRRNEDLGSTGCATLKAASLHRVAKFVRPLRGEEVQRSIRGGRRMSQMQMGHPPARLGDGKRGT